MSSKDKMEINNLEQINVKINQSKDDVINETSPNKKENWLTKLRGKKNDNFFKTIFINIK